MNIMESIPKPLIERYQNLTADLLEEVRREYSESGKQSAGMGAYRDGLLSATLVANQRIIRKFSTFCEGAAAPKKTTSRPTSRNAVISPYSPFLSKREPRDYLPFPQDKCPFPSPWRQSFLENRAKLAKWLHITNYLMVNMLSLWLQYEHFRFVDVAEITGQREAFRISGFRSLVLVDAEKCRERLLNGYVVVVKGYRWS